MKKKIFIITVNDYIIYQPTILNLYDYLTPHFDVTVISFKPRFATKQKDEQRNIVYLDINFLAAYFFQKVDFVMSKLSKIIKLFFRNFTYHYLYNNYYLPLILKKALRKIISESEIIIAVDLQVLCLVQQLFGSVHFLSLEIDNNTNRYYKKVDRHKIKSVLVQSQERYDYLFPGAGLKTFLIQNAPVFSGKKYEHTNRKDFVWAGAIDRRLAVMECLEFFNQYSGYRLILKGGGDKKTKKLIDQQYGHLIENGVVEINQEYLPAGSFIDFLSNFRIGFCFYSWQLIRDSFNYQTAPSGKLFMYLAAGTPVIACNIPGLKPVKEFGAGVLIDDYKPTTILNAVQQIEANYLQYSEACYKAAEYYNFDKHINPYIQFLLTQG